jgi:2-amino-4-hydroxy-6-hydroxymethyldihydropteridine diphosphokinase
VGERIYLSIGSNLGDRESNLRRAFALVGDICIETRLSHIFETAPLYIEDQPKFLNAVAEGVTVLRPFELLHRLQEIELSLGRNRIREMRMGPRTLDIDILLYGSLVLNTAKLTIPHPRIRERAFMLVPLLQLAPGVRDPLSGEPYRDALDRVSGQGVYSYKAV